MKRAPAHLAGFDRFRSTGEARVVGSTVELRGLRKNGEEFDLDLSLSSLELPEGVGFLANIRDSTERHRMRRRVTQSERLASLGLLSAGVAHEINNPLAFVANNLAVLSRDLTGLRELLHAYRDTDELVRTTRPELAEKLRRIAEEVDYEYVDENLERILGSTSDGVRRVAEIVKNLRGFTRIDHSSEDEANVDEAVRTSLEMIRGQLERRKVEVKSTSSDVPSVRCAPAQLNQVVLNLIVNAMQAIESCNQGGGTIEVAARSRDDLVIIEIADDGPGIPADTLKKIFDPFFTTKSVGEGTGLGLSITHGIVTDHGGKIEVENRKGRGARFRIILPAV